MLNLLQQFAKRCRVRSAHRDRRKSTGARGAPYLAPERKPLYINRLMDSRLRGYDVAKARERLR